MAETGPVGGGTRAKICGLTRREDVLVADEAGADYLGLVLTTGFSRSVEVTDAPRLVRDTRARRVAVLVDETAAHAAVKARAIDAQVIQLHGSEDPSVLTRLRSAGPWLLWKAVRAASMADLERAIARYGDRVDAFLVEGHVEGIVGGGGATLSLDPTAVRETLRDAAGFVLAGGLNADNVARTMALYRPDVVDVSSGVESSVRRKDPLLLRSFLSAVRSAPRAEFGGQGGAARENSAQ